MSTSSASTEVTEVHSDIFFDHLDHLLSDGAFLLNFSEKKSLPDDPKSLLDVETIRELDLLAAPEHYKSSKAIMANKVRKWISDFPEPPLIELLSTFTSFRGRMVTTVS